MSAPRRLVITGAAGLIGFHLRARAHGLEGFETIPLDRAAFNRVDSEASEATTGPTLGRALTDADAVVHLAGMNRGDDHELESTNIDLARRLIDALDASDRKPHLVFASSTHRDRDTAYGRSKRRSHELFSDWAEATGPVAVCQVSVSGSKAAAELLPWPKFEATHTRPSEATVTPYTPKGIVQLSTVRSASFTRTRVLPRLTM